MQLIEEKGLTILIIGRSLAIAREKKRIIQSCPIYFINPSKGLWRTDNAKFITLSPESSIKGIKADLLYLDERIDLKDLELDSISHCVSNSYFNNPHPDLDKIVYFDLSYNKKPIQKYDNFFVKDKTGNILFQGYSENTVVETTRTKQEVRAGANDALIYTESHISGVVVTI